MAKHQAGAPMALLTPPLSGKDQTLHSFAPHTSSAIDPPLFGPIINNGRRSPSEVAMRGDASHRLWSTDIASPEVRDLQIPQEWVNRRRKPVLPPSPAYGRLSKQTSSTNPSPQRALTQQEIDTVNELANFSTNFVSRWPALRLHLDQQNGTWLDVPTVYETRDTSVPEQQDDSPPPTLGRKHRHDSAYDDPSPRKKPAAPATKRQSATPHNRKRSTTSEPMQARGDNKHTRKGATKPATSKDYRDWPDFSPSPSTLDNAHAAQIAKKISSHKQYRDASGEPLVGELHPVEVEAISRYGLDCGKYLCMSTLR